MSMVKDALTDRITAAGAVALTSGSSTAHLFGFIPDDIGKLGISFSILLSVTLIISHLRKTLSDYKKTKLEIEKLKKDLEEK